VPLVFAKSTEKYFHIRLDFFTISHVYTARLIYCLPFCQFGAFNSQCYIKYLV